MIKTIRRILGGTVDAHLMEAHDIMIRCARRCAYDLGHAIDLIDNHDDMLVQMLIRKQKHWIDLFKGGNSAKDYAVRLHDELDRADETIERLYALLDAAGIEDPKDKRLPF